MDRDTLLSLGLNRRQVEMLNETGTVTLTDIQRSVLANMQGKSAKGAFVLAPTSSGKTALFPVIAMREVNRGRAAFLLVPSRAQAWEVAQRYLEPISKLGYRTNCDSPGTLKNGSVEVGVMVYESAFAKAFDLRAVLERSGGTVIFDEADICYGSSRSAPVEALLRFALDMPDVTVLALSALLRAGDALVSLSDLPVVCGYRREVPLARGVHDGERFLWVEYNSSQEGIDELPLELSGTEYNEQQHMLSLALEFHSRYEPTLVFVKDRPSTRTLTRYALSVLCADTEPTEIPPELENLPHTSSRNLLQEASRFRVGFHNSDLTGRERAVVERLLSNGHYLTVFCTSTLGSGVNFPVRNIIVESVRWEASGDGIPALRPLRTDEFDCLAGRSARLGLSDERGRAVICAHPDSTARAMTEFVRAESSTTQLPLFDADICDRLMAHLHLRRNLSLERATALLHFDNRSPQCLEPVLQPLEKASLVIRDGNTISPSPIGEITTRFCLSAHSAALLSGMFGRMGEMKPLSFFFELSACSEFETLLPPGSGLSAQKAVELAGHDSGLPLENILRYGLDNSSLRRLKAALVLDRFFSGESPQDIEARIRVSAGVQERLAKLARAFVNAGKRMASIRADKAATDFLESLEKGRNEEMQIEETDAERYRPVLMDLGTGRDRSGYISICGARVRLPLSSYELFKRLLNAARSDDPWVRVSALMPDGDTERARKYVSQLRALLKPYAGGNPVQNDGKGCYRINEEVFVRGARTASH
ncbi:MAG: DEAD/DEAH box helicase [Planctomycetota bacterium]|nr:DEAD/DEAH box helicase [Planctomycetota bacterium]